ncbi:hypothetical protein B0H11DRAFT_1921922 [Mycena galericulata]|nr:hypothetical protein B0H11DRAFT_1921922 [Mycena galericulata]
MSTTCEPRMSLRHARVFAPGVIPQCTNITVLLRLALQSVIELVFPKLVQCIHWTQPFSAHSTGAEFGCRFGASGGPHRQDSWFPVGNVQPSSAFHDSTPGRHVINLVRKTIEPTGCARCKTVESTRLYSAPLAPFFQMHRTSSPSTLPGPRSPNFAGFLLADAALEDQLTNWFFKARNNIRHADIDILEKFQFFSSHLKPLVSVPNSP